MQRQIESELSNKNITIIRSFIVIAAISVLATLVIGISSFVTINETHRNVKLMYENCLQRQVLLSSINVKLNNLRNDTSAQIDYPKDTYKENINKALDDIYTNWDQYKSLDCTGDNEIMNNLIDELILGLERSCNNITKIKNDDYIDDKVKDMYKADFHGYDYSISVTVSEATLKNKVDAEQLFNQIDKAYGESIIIFIVLFIISIISIFLVATVLIKLLKKSIRSFTSILDTLAMGDFTAYIRTDEKSEIGIMKKNLAATISSISHIIKLIKGVSELTLEKSKSLAEVSKEMDSTMWEVTNEICGITEGAAVQSNELIVINSTFSRLEYKFENITTSIKEVDKNTQSVNDKAQNSNAALSALIKTINTISKAFDNDSREIQNLGIKILEINKITEVIIGIADKINLLSLEASIEASRVGGAGKEFLSIAEEIKKLSEQSKSSSNEINILIQDISKETSTVVNTTNDINKKLNQQIIVIEDSVQDFKKIIQDINAILPQIEEINNTVEEINNEKNYIIKKIESTTSIAKENSESSEKISNSIQVVTLLADGLAKTAQLLEDNSNNLIKQVNNFKLEKDIK